MNQTLQALPSSKYRIKPIRFDDSHVIECAKEEAECFGVYTWDEKYNVWRHVQDYRTEKEAALFVGMKQHFETVRSA